MKRTLLLGLTASLLVAAQDQDQERARPGYLGITTHLTLKGLKVDVAVDGGPAAEAGVKKGDLILKFEGKRVKWSNALTRAAGRLREGDEVTLTVQRDGSTLEIAVTLGAQPRGRGRGGMGMGLSLQAGDTAPKLILEDLEGYTIELAKLYKEKPVVIEFGAWT